MSRVRGLLEAGRALSLRVVSSSRRGVVLSGLWMGLIFSLSSIDGRDFPTTGLPSVSSLLAHVGIYAGLGWLLALTLFRTRIPEPWSLIAPIVIAVLFGVSDEFHQSFVPYRTPSVGDVIADGMGAMWAIGIWRYTGRIGS